MAAPFNVVFALYPAHHAARLHRTLRSAHPPARRTLRARLGRRAATSKWIPSCASPGFAASTASMNATCSAFPAASAPWPPSKTRPISRRMRRLGAKARYITSVCTGSLLLAAAGLLAWQARGLPLGVARQARRLRRHAGLRPRRARRHHLHGRRRHRGNRHGARGHGGNRRPRPRRNRSARDRICAGAALRLRPARAGARAGAARGARAPRFGARRARRGHSTGRRRARPPPELRRPLPLHV